MVGLQSCPSIIGDRVRTAAADFIQNAKIAFQSGAAPQPTLHLGYDDKPSEHAFYGTGSYQTHPVEEQIFDFPSPFERDTQMVFSAWTYLNPGPWSAGFWILSVRDAAGTEIHHSTVETRKRSN